VTGDEVIKETMCMGDKSDIEVAHLVRMLYRDTLNHEAVCTAARDRIMYLSQQVERLEQEVDTRKKITTILNQLESIKKKMI